MRDSDNGIGKRPEYGQDMDKEAAKRLEIKLKLAKRELEISEGAINTLKKFPSLTEVEYLGERHIALLVTEEGDLLVAFGGDFSNKVVIDRAALIYVNKY